MKKILIPFLALIMLSSCSKEEESKAANDLLCAMPWKMTAKTSTLKPDPISALL
ncbi:MAG: hypothetical protein ACI8ZN_001911 [Bacteroidia bacterium]|jgi:hypothetical protein